jgi:hypothetical protein
MFLTVKSHLVIQDHGLCAHDNICPLVTAFLWEFMVIGYNLKNFLLLPVVLEFIITVA